MKTRFTLSLTQGRLRITSLFLFAVFTLLGLSYSSFGQIVIGTGTSSTLNTGTGSSSLQSPYNSYYGYTWAQTLYLRNEINAADGNITSISFNYTGTSLTNSNQVKIYMANVVRSAFTSTTNWEPVSNMTLVFDGVLSGTLPGAVTINLTTPFPYQSNMNLIVAVDENAAGDDGQAGYSASNLGAGRVIFYRSDSNNPDPASPPTASGLSSYVGNIQISGLTALTCQPPTAITVPSTTITTTSAPFSFTAPATSTPTSYQWEVRTTGAPGSGSPVASGTTTASSLNGTATGLAAGTTYTLYVRSSCGSGQFSAWSSVNFTSAYAPPANDECSTATSLTVNGTLTCTSSSNGTTIAATASTSEIASSVSGGANDDVWYKFTATSTNARVSLTSITGTDNDMYMDVYTGNCGALTSFASSDPNVLDLANLSVGQEYKIRVYTYSSSTSSTASFTICVGTPPNMTYSSSTTTQPSTSSVVQGATSQSIIRVNVVSSDATNPISVTQLNFNTTGSTNAADIANAKVYYTGTSTTFSTATQFGTVVANPNGTFSVTGSQALAGTIGSTTNNYFFLAYDVACSATATDLLDAQCTGIVVGGVTQTPTNTNPTGTRTITAATFSAATAQPSTDVALAGSINQQVLRIDVSGCATNIVTTLNFNTGLSNTPAHILNAKVYYTTASTFATTTQFGSTVNSPSGNFTVTGSQALGASTGYFWLTYDLSQAATAADTIDAASVSVISSGNTLTPATTNPTGVRLVAVSPSNDEAINAIQLTVGAGCTGAPYTNAYATQSANEKFTNVRGTAGYTTVWFKFVAPASGMVKISNDYSGGTAGNDTRLGLFSASDPSNYATFTSLAGDDDNGTTISARSVIFYAGLTPGTTYYIAEDGYSSSTTTGTFCITVEELNSSMLATAGTCTAGDGSIAENNFTGWRSLVTSTGLLIANVKQNPGSSSTLTASINVNTGAVRKDANNLPYLDRNYSFSGASATAADVQLFFSAADFAALNGTVQGGGGAALTLANLNVTHQTGATCQGNFAQSNGTNTVLTQTGSGTVNGLDFIQITTPGFSNFYIMGGTTPLPLHLISFEGQNKGAANNLTWVTAEEKNFSHFELQRSANGIDFSKLDIIDSKNNANGSTYNYSDNRPLEGKNFYRLLMIDRNGANSLSNVVELTAKGGSGFAVTVHPNPVSALMQINVAGKVDGKATLLIVDVMGKVVKTIYPTGNAISVDMSGMPAGTYVVKYFDNTNSVVTKITKN